MQETSEDEEKKKADAEAKKKKKGLTQEDLDAIHDVELKETNTICFLNIPGTIVVVDSDHDTQTQELNKKYEELRQNKIGSDSYMNRGSQTLNLTQKSKNVNYIGFT